MKARLTILVLILSLALAACSLAEDITPPANYSTPSSISVTLPATQTPIPPATKTSAPTLEPATATATAETSPATAGSNTPVATDSNTPAATDSTTPAAEISPTAQPSMVVIDGTVTVASGAVIPTGTVATLLVYDTTAGQVTQTLTAPILAGGNYEFSNVPATTTTVYLTSVDYGDVTYDSVPAQFDGTVFQFNMPITVYDSTTDLSVLTITQAHLQFDFSTASQVQVMVLYVITNPGGSTVVVTSDGTSIPFIHTPKDAGSVLWFGTQADQSSLAPSLVVCSQVYDWTGMLKDMIAKHKAGTLGGETYTLTLSNGGLTMVYNPGYTLAADVKAAGDAAISGSRRGGNGREGKAHHRR